MAKQHHIQLLGSALWRLPVMIITIPLRVGASPPSVVGVAVVVMALVILLIRLIGIVIPGFLSP